MVYRYTLEIEALCKITEKWVKIEEEIRHKTNDENVF